MLREMISTTKALQSLQPDPLDVMGKTLRNIQQARELTAPTEREKLERREQQEIYKYTVNKFSDAIMDKNTSPAARKNMKGLLESWAYSLPERQRAALLPALAYSPIGPKQRELDELMKRMPPPEKPAEGRTPETRHDWAEYDWKMQMHEARVHKIMGLDFEPRRLMPTDDPDTYSFRDPMSKQIGFVDLKNVPKDLLKRAVDEHGDTLTGIVERGALTVRPAKKETIGRQQYWIGQQMDLRSGKVVTTREPIGRASGKGPKIPGGLQKVLAVANGIGDEEDAPLEYRPHLGLLKEAEDAIKKHGTEKGIPPALAEVNQRLMNEGAGYMVTPYDEKVQESWWSWFPGVGTYSVQDGLWMAVPVDGTIRHMVGGQEKTFYRNQEHEVSVDGLGRPIEGSQGLNDGDALPEGAEGEEPRREVSPEEEKQVIGAAEMLGNEAEGQGVTVGQALMAMGEALKSWPEGQRGHISKELRTMLAATGHNSNDPIPASELVRMVKDLVKPEVEGAKMSLSFIWAWLGALGDVMATPLSSLFRWLYEAEIPGTGTEEGEGEG